MQHIHSLCPICNKFQYKGLISNLNHSDFTTLNQQTHSILNPIISITEDQQNQIVQLQHQYYISFTKQYPFPFDSLYGYDFFIQGCYLLIVDKLTEAIEHYQIYEKIQNYTRGIFKRQSQEIKKITSLIFNEICDELIAIINKNFQQYNNISGQSQDFLNRISQVLLKQIEDLQFISHEIYQTELQLTYDKKEKLHRLQIQLACYTRDFSEEAIFTKLYYQYLQCRCQTDQIGAILFKEIIHCQKLWEIYFTKITPNQRLSHITSLVYYLNKGQFDQSLLINMISLGHALKNQKEYWLSFVMYSLFRKFSKLLKGINNFDHLIPIVYYQMAKLCIYLGQFNESYKLYQESLAKLRIQQNLTQIGLFSKLLHKLLMLSIFLNKNEEAINYSKELQQQTNIPFHIYVFNNYFNHQLLSVLQSQQKYRKFDQFKKHLHSFIIKNSSPKLIPTDDLKKIANIIELKDQDIPRNVNKIEVQLPQKCNLFFNSLQFYFILVGNLNPDQFTPDQFNTQQNLLDNLLQNTNEKLHKVFGYILENFQIPNNYYENLLLCHFYQHISEYRYSQYKLDMFLKTIKNWKKKISLQDYQIFLKTIENYQSKLLSFDQQSQQHSIYVLGTQQIKTGKFREGVENLIQVAIQHSSQYFEKCYDQLFELLKKSRETDQFKFGEFRNDVKEFIKQINFEQLYNQTIDINRSLSCSQIIGDFQAAKSLEVSQYYRSNSSFYENEDYQFTDLPKLFQDQLVIDLIHLVSDEQARMQPISMKTLSQIFPQRQELQKDVMLYYNDHEKIVVKTKSIANMDKSIVEQKLKETLIEIQCQMLVNKLKNPAFAEMISLQYHFIVSSKYAIHFEFYMIFPYYEPLESMSLNQLSYLTESIRILNENQIYHRDLKPSNILMKDNHSVIIDFDCSYYWEPTLKLWLGGNGLTNHYYPKDDEQFDKVDIYSLGVIAKEKVVNCSEEFFLSATMRYKDRCSLSMLLEKIN